MLIGACLEALVGIGDANSLATIRRRFPELATLPDFFLVSCLKAIGALGTEREFAEVAGLLAVRGAQLRPAILAALIAIHQRYPGTAHDEDVLPVLRIVIEQQDAPLCRYQAVRALGFVSSRDDVYCVPYRLPDESGAAGAFGSNRIAAGNLPAWIGGTACRARPDGNR